MYVLGYIKQIIGNVTGQNIKYTVKNNEIWNIKAHVSVRSENLWNKYTEGRFRSLELG